MIGHEVHPLLQDFESFGRSEMNPMNPRSLIGSCFLATIALAVAQVARSAEPTVALKDVFKVHFPVGTAVNRSMVSGGAGSRRSAEQIAGDVAVLKQHFNQIVAENDTKCQLIHPREGSDGYDFGPTDALFSFGLRNGMELAGHTLVWHSQTPNWVLPAPIHRLPR